MSRVFANGRGDRNSIAGRAIPKTQKMELYAALLSTQYYKVRVKWKNLEKEVAPSPTPRCSSYWKGSLQVTLDKDRQLYLLYCPFLRINTKMRFGILIIKVSKLTYVEECADSEPCDLNTDLQLTSTSVEMDCATGVHVAGNSNIYKTSQTVLWETSRAYALLSVHRWNGTHFGCLCWSVHGSGLVCPGSCGSRLRPSDIDSGKPAFMSDVPRLASSSLRGPSPLALTLFGGVRFIAWRLRNSDGSEAFLEPPGVSGLRPDAWTPLKKALPHSSGRWDVRQIPTSWDVCKIDVKYNIAS